MRVGRAVVLVDVGYLLKAVLIHLGQPSRESVDIDWQALTQILGELAAEETGLHVLRQTWYDAAYSSRLRTEHRALASIPGVHVKLGWIVTTTRGPQQKAVDTAIVRDLCVHAAKTNIEDVVLIAGDGDLVPGAQETIEHGQRLHLWGVSLGDQVDDTRVRQSEELVQVADKRLLIDVADLATHVTLRGQDTQPGAEAAGDVAPEPPLTANLPETDSADARPVDSVDLEESVLSPPGPTPNEAVRLGPMSLHQLSSWAQKQADAAEDEQADLSPCEWGARYGQRWWVRATEANRDRLMAVARRPGLPRFMDRDLLFQERTRGVDIRDDEAARHDLRRGFWSALPQEHGQAS